MFAVEKWVVSNQLATCRLKLPFVLIIYIVNMMEVVIFAMHF